MKSLALGGGAVVLLGAAIGFGYMLRGSDGDAATTMPTQANVPQAMDARPAPSAQPAPAQAAPAASATPVYDEDQSGPPASTIQMDVLSNNPPPVPGNRLAVLMTENKPLYYVILGSYPDAKPVPQGVERVLSQCLGVTPHVLTTGYFQGLAPNLQVQLFGGFTKAEAEKVREWVLECAPDAYIKQATWIGD